MKKNKSKSKRGFARKFIFSVVILFLFFSIFHPVFAQYTNQEKIPGAQPTQDFIQYLKDIINFGFAVIGILALFMLIIGAYQYLMAAGNIGKVDAAKETIGSALLGLILGLCAYIILNKINPDLVNMRAIYQISGGVGGSALTVRGTVDLSTVTGNIPGTIKERMAEYDKYVQEAAKKYNVDPNLVRAVIEQESTWNPYAIRANADFGMMQINQKYHPNFFANNDWRDPSANINYGTQYLSTLLQQSGGDSYTALARYNAGGSGENKFAGQTYASSVMTRYANYQKSGA